MSYNLFIKRLRWIISATLITIALVAGFWFHPFITAAALIISWLSLMLYMDPPQKWQ